MRQNLGLNQGRNLTVAVSSVTDGNMSWYWGDRDEVLRNRKLFLKNVNLSVKKGIALDVRGSKGEILVVDEGHAGTGMEVADRLVGEGLVTSSVNVYLFLLTADCFPLVLFDDCSGVFGLFHCGMRSLDDGVISSGIETMVRTGAELPTLSAWIGPGIGKDSYIKDRRYLDVAFDKWKCFLDDAGDSKVKIDLKGFLFRELKNNGVEMRSIVDCGVDTGSNERFFSHYVAAKDGEDEGRFATVVWMQ